MSSSEGEGSAPAPTDQRRSGRVSNGIERLGKTNGSAQKSTKPNYGESDSEKEANSAVESDAENAQTNSEEEEEEISEVDEETVPKSNGKGKGKAVVKVKPTLKKPKKKAEPKGTASTKEAEISEDNNLYNAVSDPNTSLESIVDDWIESYKSDAGPAMAELINFVLRSSGCNSTIDEHQAEDENGVVEVLADIDGEFKKASLLAYPLISKSKPLRKFRSCLQSFLNRLFAQSASADILYDTSFCQVFQSWLSSLSSSTIRSFRHTATVISLGAVEGLCAVAVAVNKEFASASRAKEAEQQKGRKDKSRLKDLGKNVEEVHERKTKLEEYLSELFEAVFVHRYRDSEPVIRSECIKSLGSWMTMYPDYWLEGNYLRYIGWVLSDDNKDVRHESIKALLSLYTKDEHIASMQHFTERFKGQIVRMATSEIDLSVRISCIIALQSINVHGLLEPEQRDEIAKLIFSDEKRVRQAVASFFDTVLVEEVEERTAEMEASITSPKKGKKADLEARVGQLRLKCLAELLLKYSDQTDGKSAEEPEEEIVEEKLSTDMIGNHQGRLALAVEALWEQVPAIKDWEEMMQFLLLDHSEFPSEEQENLATPNGKSNGRKAKGKKADLGSDGAVIISKVQEMCKLLEKEETLLVEVLVATLARASKGTGLSTTKKDKAKEDAALSQISRSVIRHLPRLFAKYSTLPARMINILVIPRLVKLDDYLDMQQTSAYESLWDDVTKQFLKYTETEVLDQAIATIGFFLSSAVLGNSNGEKIMELEDALISSLRQSVDEKDVETTAYDEDELSTICAWVTRISKLFSVRDISTSLEDTDGNKSSSAWEILDSLVERGRLGYKEEGIMIERAVGILSLHLQWRVQRLLSDEDGVLDEEEITVIKTKRDTLLSKLEDLSLGTTSNAVEGVKQVALSQLLGLYTTFASITSKSRDPDARLAILKISCNDQLQARCAGFVEAEIERYEEAIMALDLSIGEEEEPEEEVEVESDAGSEEETSSKKKAKKPKKKSVKKLKSAKKVVTSVAVQNAKKLSILLTNEHFNLTISPFVRAIHAEVIDIRHSSIIIANSGRLGATFDQLVKLLASDLRDEAIYGGQAENVARVMFETFRDASEQFLTSEKSNEDSLIAVSKVLASSLLVRGPSLSIAKTFPPDDHARIHIDCNKFIVEKIISYETKEQKTKAIFLFKPLSNLIKGLNGRIALKIKNALDSNLHDVDVPTTARQWEPLRSYQKSLTTLAAKDPTVKASLAAKKNRKSALSVLSDVEEDEVEGGSSPVKNLKPKAKRSKGIPAKSLDLQVEPVEEFLPPRSRRASDTRSYGGSNKRQKLIEVVHSDMEEEEEVTPAIEADEVEPITREATPMEIEEAILPISSPSKSKSKSKSKKRSQIEMEPETEEEEEELVVEKQGLVAPHQEEEPSSQGSTMSISDFKKKRARR